MKLVRKTLRQLLMKKKDRKLKESDAEKVSLVEEGKKIGINEVIKHNELINNSLK